jgi:hypothetical protein
MCSKCAFEEHSDHKSAVSDISKVQVGDYLEKMNVKIMEKISNLIKLQEAGLYIKSGKATATEFIEY